MLNDFNLYDFKKFEIDYFNLIAYLPSRPINSSKLVVIFIIKMVIKYYLIINWVIISVILIKHPNIDM